MSKLIIKTFTSSGSWTAPAGITKISVRMFGGGQSGSDGDTSMNFSPAYSSTERVFFLTVVPNTSYTITIGAGGSGGAGAAGANTTFGSLATAVGAGGFIESDDFNTFNSIGNGFQSATGVSAYGFTNGFGTDSGANKGGPPGMDGPGGDGGDGGNAAGAGSGANGTAAAANSGGGGGGGGGDNTSGGTGGNGGSGYLEISWVE